MSEAEAKNDKRWGDEELPPTASFGGASRGPGGKIGQFRIERELGRGGAGVVYLGHDTKLDRSVAIKSLPAELMDNPKARSRFAREARVLASLNHPNIATIYEELKEAEGVGYLVLEYIPGDTLAERIRRGRLKLEEALTIGLQIAEAVAAAHEHGVIHRDLKAGNIKITPEGKVKVLDFGLAKAVSGETLDQQSTITQPGQVMGTPSYMSPEQARGQPIDERSDIWSFGCVLYEMLTAKVPFKGETISDTMAGILEREPDWQVLPQDTPANILVLLRRCLEKDRHRRLQHIGDAVIEIDETLNLPATAPPTITLPRLEAARRTKLQTVAIMACVALVCIVGAVALWRPWSTGPIDKHPVMAFEIEVPEDVSMPARQAMAISPEGTYIAFVGRKAGAKQLYLRSLKRVEVTAVPGTEGAQMAFFSPDAQWLGYATTTRL